MEDTHNLPVVHDGIVVMVDALGMKARSEREDLLRVIEDWQKVVDSFRSSKTGLKVLGDMINPEIPGPAVKWNVRSFQDTVLAFGFAATGSRVNSADLLGDAALLLMGPFWKVMTDQYGMGCPTFLRGAVAAGRFAVSQEALLGPAVNDAAAWYEQAEWFGVLVTPRTALMWEKEFPQAVPAGYTKYDIPLKGGILKDGFALAWPEEASEEEALIRTLKAGEKKTTSRRQLLLDALGKDTIPPSLAQKHLNTLAFYDWYLSRQRGSS